jgi:Outer membrane protein transport protein (OMPP1/FadL/TodX).
MNKFRVITFVFFFLLGFSIMRADDGSGKSSFNPLTVGVPSLTIAPDARAGSMGDLGVATDPDIFSQYWNPAKYAFSYSKAGVGLSYTPWLRSLVSDIDLVYLAGYYKLGDTDRHAIGASLRYFSLGEIDMFDGGGTLISSASPYEMSFDVGYSLKLTENFSGAATFRFIYSDLNTGAENMEAGTAWAADVAGYYNKYVMLGNSECLLGLGFNVSNIGTKISYDLNNTTNFIPTNLRIGGSLLFPMDDYNTLSIGLDLNKYLIPTPPNTEGMTTEEKQQALDDYAAISPISGMFKSFNDAPGGMKEEFEEIMWSVGAEYAYNNQFFVRGGYHYESPNKGNRQYFSLGAGFKMTSLQLDVAYLISTVPSNPLDQTLRFSLSFDMDGLRNLMR